VCGGESRKIKTAMLVWRGLQAHAVVLVGRWNLTLAFFVKRMPPMIGTRTRSTRKSRVCIIPGSLFGDSRLAVVADICANVRLPLFAV